MRIIELITDPSSKELSASRLCLLISTIFGVGIAVYLALHGGGLHAAGIVTGLAATAAGVYWASTKKHFRENCDEEDTNSRN